MSYNPNNPNGQATMANSEPVVIASNQTPIAIDVAKDMFEHVVVSGRYNQIEISFDQTDPDLIADVTVTKTNGGDASNLNGQAVFTSGSNTSGGVKCVTNSTVVYRPNSEIFAEFTSIFTAGIANSYQRIGVYDTNNGFFIGYEGTSFGITIRKAGVDTTTARASFNIDTLTGASDSKYTRNGVPETLDTTKDNLYRIRFGWLGAAPIVFEVLSPDGEWVLFHIIRHPNTTAGTSINNPDLPITLDIQKTSAGATVLTMSTACWAVGTSSDLQKVSSVLTDNTLVKAVRSVLVAKLPSGSYSNIDATTGGNLKVSIEELDPGVTVPVSGTVTVNAGTGTMNVSVQNASIPVSDNGGSLTVDGTVAATQSGSWNVGLNAGSNAIGSITNTSFAATQATAANLNATVVGTGTFAVQATQSGAWTVRTADGTGNALNATLSDPTGSERGLVVRNIPSGTQTVSGTVTANAGTGTMNVSVQNASIPVTDNGGSLTIDGSVSVSNFPATQVVSATDLDIRNLTATDVVTVTGGVGQTADVKITLDSEQVSISNFPATQTVSGTVAATQSGTWSVRTQDASGNGVTSHLAGSSRGIDVSIIDGSGNQITSFGGGTQYTDGAAVATPTGTAILGHDGSNVHAVSTNASGHVNIADGGNTITVDGTVAATQSGTWNIGTLTSITNTVTVSGSVTADTELATAAALADGAANPTTSTVGAASLGFNGTTWDRLKSEATNTDGETVSTGGSLSTCSHDEVFNGTSWDRMRAANALDGTGATSHTGVLAVLQPNKRFNPTNLATAANSTSVVDINGANTARVAIGTSTTGTFIIEVTADGTNWQSAEVYSPGGDSWLSGQNLTPTSSAVYTVLVGSWRAMRLRTVTTLGATVQHFVTLSMSQGVISAIDTGPAPHAIGYTILSKSGEYTTTQTGVALWTPTTGRKFVITDFTISTGGTTSGIVTLWQGASGDTTYTVGTDPVLFRGEFAPSATAKPGVVKALSVPFVSTTTNHILRVTTSAAMTIYVQVNGYEIV